MDTSLKQENTIVDTMAGIGRTVVEVTEELYYYGLEVVPPIYQRGFFMVGEPLSHTAEGVEYTCFCNRANRYWAVDATAEQAAKLFTLHLQEVTV